MRVRSQEHSLVPHDEQFLSLNTSGPSSHEEDYHEEFFEDVLPVGSTWKASNGLRASCTDVRDDFVSRSHAAIQGSYASAASKSMGASLDVGSPVSEDISEVQMYSGKGPECYEWTGLTVPDQACHNLDLTTDSGRSKQTRREWADGRVICGICKNDYSHTQSLRRHEIKSHSFPKETPTRLRTRKECKSLDQGIQMKQQSLG